MYFWRIEKLKTEMAARPLSEREALPYLVVFVALSSAVAYIPQTTYSLWDGLGGVWSVLLAAVGTIYIYRQNGGAGGQHFLQRYFAVGWVVVVRWFVVLILVAVAFYGTLAGHHAFGKGSKNLVRQPVIILDEIDTSQRKGVAEVGQIGG